MATAKQKQQDKFTPVDFQRGGKVKTANTAEEAVRLRFNGWKAKEAKKASTSASSTSTQTSSNK